MKLLDKVLGSVRILLLEVFLPLLYLAAIGAYWKSLWAEFEWFWLSFASLSLPGLITLAEEIRSFWRQRKSKFSSVFVLVIPSFFHLWSIYAAFKATYAECCCCCLKTMTAKETAKRSKLLVAFADVMPQIIIGSAFLARRAIHDADLNLDLGPRSTFLIVGTLVLSAVCAEHRADDSKLAVALAGIPFYALHVATRAASLGILAAYLSSWFVVVPFIAIGFNWFMAYLTTETDNVNRMKTAYCSLLAPVAFFDKAEDREAFRRRNGVVFSITAQAFAVGIQVCELLALDARFAESLCATWHTPLIACFARRSDGRILFILVLLGLISIVNTFVGNHAFDIHRAVFKQYF